MKVLLGATLAWVLIGTALGYTILKIMTAHIVWPFVVVLAIVTLLITYIGCRTD